MNKMFVLAQIVLLLFAFNLTAEQPFADEILVNGRIFTSSAAQPYVEALAIKGERIISVGTTQQISALAGSQTKRIDLTGHVVIPGINDAHYHLFSNLKGFELQFTPRNPLGTKSQGHSRKLYPPPRKEPWFSATQARWFLKQKRQTGTL